LPYNVFADAYVDTGIYVFKKSANNDYQSMVYEFDPKTQIEKNTFKNIEFKQLHCSKWQNTKLLKIVFNETNDLKDKLFENSISIEQISKSVRGILATPNDLAENQINDGYKPLFNGKMTSYSLENKFLFVHYGNQLKEKPKSYDFFTGERILIRRIISRQFRVMAHLVETEFVNKKDIYNLIVTDKRFNSKYILAIVNSKLISFLKVNSSNAAKKDDFTQLTLSDIREIPIKIISETAQKPIIALVEAILAQKKSDSSVSTADLEGMLDRLVYELYDLNASEIAIIEKAI
jgi:hypothetical protein